MASCVALDALKWYIKFPGLSTRGWADHTVKLRAGELRGILITPCDQVSSPYLWNEQYLGALPRVGLPLAQLRGLYQTVLVQG